MLTDRLRKMIQDSGLSLPRFATRAGVSKNTLINYRDGATSPTAEFLERVCREFSVHPQWLLLGTGKPYAEPPPKAPDDGSPPILRFAPGAEAEEEYVLLPLLASRVTAGPEGEILYEEVEDHYPFKRWWLERLVGRSPDRLRDLLLIKVRGDSMSPTINQGEIALVDTFEAERFQVLTGRIYLVILPEGSASLKRLVLSRDEEAVRLVCLSDNTTDYRPFEFALEPEKALKNHILGRVRWVGKEFD